MASSENAGRARAARGALLLLALALGGCNLGGAVTACSEDSDCPESSHCDAELEACVSGVGDAAAPDAGAPDAGR
ncbi:hypothetical protein FGE12_20130 [Aggregicoccus sp. 17bor-14]|uniref:hypothetical protein n=1 Tax=Myxococcaceae TaxID=31 RepID=UPI00129D110A|nr:MULTISPECIES: hypothetical protein [Myxococcaceae]MBF5044720.1 hypothetical protein [Simulacricoccus sp. 17bor-14]MRI90464.1 hypothetical protein [Aggregicoccus sp. 17bor-14]